MLLPTCTDAPEAHNLVMSPRWPLLLTQRTLLAGVYVTTPRKIVDGGTRTAGLPIYILYFVLSLSVCMCLPDADSWRAQGLCEDYSKPAPNLSAALRRACQKSFLEQARRAWSCMTQCTRRF